MYVTKHVIDLNCDRQVIDINSDAIKFSIQENHDIKKKKIPDGSLRHVCNYSPSVYGCFCEIMYVTKHVSTILVCFVG